VNAGAQCLKQGSKWKGLDHAVDGRKEWMGGQESQWVGHGDSARGRHSSDLSREQLTIICFSDISGPHTSLLLLGCGVNGGACEASSGSTRL
jgi:hypothetical protein